jgi:malonate transporter MadM subunit
MIKLIEDLFIKNGFIFSFLLVGIMMVITEFLSKRVIKNKIPGVALAIILGLILAGFGKEKGIANIPMFAGMAILGGSMMRDFAIVSTALGASFDEIKKAGWIAVLSLFIGIFFSFTIGTIVSYAFGYRDAESIATIASGACTFIVGPITGSAVGASSEVITLSIAAGVVKVLIVTVFTPLTAKRIGLVDKNSAMVFGGIMGTTSGVSAGLAATDMKLVPYGAITATFYTGLACLICPSVLYPFLKFILS